MNWRSGVLIVVLATAPALGVSAQESPDAGSFDAPSARGEGTPPLTTDSTPASDAGVAAPSISPAPLEAPRGGTVVTATRLPRPLRDVPSTVSVLPRQEIDRSPTLTPDDLLRTLPSVATFRRNSSLVADPSAQGMNLRGLGPSGVSRSLVLIDGVPANDPFGGWVYWRAVPRLGIERAEVSPSGASALYGNFALGGVTQLFSRPIDRASVDADVVAGSFRTVDASARAAGRIGSVGGALEGELLTSRGYTVVVPEQRGAIDTNTPSTSGTVNGRAEWSPAPGARLFLRGSFFQESENGGTQYTTAFVRQASLGLGAQLERDSGLLDLNLFAGVQRFEQDRARVAADRSSEALSGHQRVPSNNQGGSATWSTRELHAAGTHVLLVGADVQRVSGNSEEQLYPPKVTPNTTTGRVAGGEQQFAGLFAQDAYRLSDALAVTAAARLDLWRNSGGHRHLDRQSGPADFTFANHSDVQLSPKLGVLGRPLPWLTLRASGYRAFRAPTLNELYRPFQVGTVLTAANENLQAETLWGAEAGAEVEAGHGLIARATGFLNRLDSPITNVTLATPLADGSTRQRQNLGRARVPGVELEVDWRIARQWVALVGYTFMDPVVSQSPGHPELEGKRLAQDPQHRGTAALTFDDPRIVTATVELRVIGPQFEDDQNKLPMGGYLLVDLSASRRIYRGLEAFAAVENLFDRRYLVGRSGIDTQGEPLAARIGLRLRSP